MAAGKKSGNAFLVVADAGPLIALAVGGVLPLCITMLGGLIVPEAVLLECTADISAPGAAILQNLSNTGKFEIVPAASLMPLDTAYAQGLGGGEVAVLSYAAQHALLAMIDERRARRVAARLGVAVVGSGALIAQLKRQGLIQSVKPVLSSWKQHGYFVSEPVVRDILSMAAEL
jgi:predicted nucleic acid-binding protein